MTPLWLVLRSALEPLAAIRTLLFLATYLLAAVVWSTGTGEVELQAKISNPDLRAALQLLLGVLDPLLLVLASLVLHQCNSTSEGLRGARNWVLFTFAISLTLAWVNLFSGLPLGRMAFTSRLGPGVFHAPLGWCLLWYAILTGSRAMALVIRPKSSHAGIAAASGLISAASGIFLELGARQIRSWWIWSPGVVENGPRFPWPFPVALGLLSFVAAFVLRPTAVQTLSAAPERLAALVFLLLNLLFLLPHLQHLMA